MGSDCCSDWGDVIVSVLGREVLIQGNRFPIEVLF